MKKQIFLAWGLSLLCLAVLQTVQADAAMSIRFHEREAKEDEKGIMNEEGTRDKVVLINKRPGQNPQNRMRRIKHGLYIVQKGDTLTNLAQRVYGSQKMWRSIYSANLFLEDPNKLTVGKIINLPETTSQNKARP